MKVGIMQPYFIPYIGYWQLMNAVDKYVVYDDVNYIKRGWINRNRILINGQPKYFNVPILGESQYKLINEIQVNNDSKIIQKNLRTIECAYKKAPYFEDVFPLVRKIVESNCNNIAEYNYNSFKIINRYLKINTELVLSSDLQKDNSMKGQDKILAICEILNATEYYNAIGGQELYNYSCFAEKGMKLHFLKTENINYKQFGADFQPNLSILDVMMFNSPEKIQEYLQQYTLI